MPDRLPENMSEYMSGRMPEYMSVRMPENIQEIAKQINIRPDMSWWGSHEVK